MSSNNYTYLGPIVEINDNAKINYNVKICHSLNCIKNNIKNNIRENDKFCSECGAKIGFKKMQKELGNVSSMYELCEKISCMENFEDYLEFPEMTKNTMILNMESIKKHGFYMSADDFNFVILNNDFNIENKIEEFKKEIENNGLKKILDENLRDGDYRIIYGIINFGDC